MTPISAAVLRVLGFAAVIGGLVAGSAQLPNRLELAPMAASAPTGPLSPSSSPVTQLLFGCPGPETEGVSGLPAVPGEVTSIRAATAPTEAIQGIASAPNPGAVTVRSSASDVALATTATRGAVVSGDVSGAVAAEVSATGSLAVGVAALQTGVRREGDERGLQASACQTPSSQVWLLAGGGAATRRERLVVANAGANSVTVDIQVHGSSGPIASVNGARVAVPPHGRVGVLVDAIAPGEATPAVHVTATGGLITALLEDSWIDGATGRGRDDVGPANGPATEQVIPAAYLTGVGRLRIVVPGTDEAVVQSRALSPNGAVPLPADQVVRIPGGSVRDIDLSGVEPGAYALQVRADRPIVASVVVERRTADAPQSDLAWVPATAAIPVLAGTPLPAGTAARLLLVGTAVSWAATVYVVGPSGAVTSIPAQGVADSSWTVDLPSGASAVWVRPSSGTVRAGLSAEIADPAGPLVTVVGINPAPLSTTAVPVREVGR